MMRIRMGGFRKGGVDLFCSNSQPPFPQICSTVKTTSIVITYHMMGEACVHDLLLLLTTCVISSRILNQITSALVRVG